MTGCASVATNDPFRIIAGSESPSTPPSPAAAPTPTTKPRVAAPYPDMTFEAGQAIPPAAAPQMADSLAGSAAWSLTGPDNGNGQRSYTSTDGKCEVRFKRTVLDPAAVRPGDDRSTTDSLLASLFRYSPERVAAHGVDGTVDFGEHGSSATTQVRTFAGANKDGSQWLTLVRAFTSPSVGLYADLSCREGADHKKVFGKVLGSIHVSTG